MCKTDRMCLFHQMSLALVRRSRVDVSPGWQVLARGIYVRHPQVFAYLILSLFLVHFNFQHLWYWLPLT